MHRLLGATALSLVLLVATVPASAQMPRPERPYRGLFGGGLQTGETEQLLTATVSFGGGYDDNLALDARASGRPRVSDLNTTRRGGTGQFSGALSYSMNRGRLNFGGSAGTSARYYPSLADAFVRRDNVRVSTSARLADGLMANASAGYRPYSLASMFASADPSQDDPLAQDMEFVSSADHYLTYSGGVSFSRGLSQRMSVGTDYAYRVRESSSEVGRFSSHDVGGRLAYALDAGLGLRAGYRYVESLYTDAERRPQNHLIDAGVDYKRNLSFSRRTTMSFSTGTTATTRYDETRNRTRFQLTGNAALNHEIGRSWHAALAYVRGVRFMESWPEPVSTDAVTASLGGLLGRSVDVRAAARASTGRVGFNVEGSSYRSYYGTGSLGVALSRHLKLEFSYAYYHHRFDSTASLVPGFTNRVNRHSLRGYLNVWAPLFQRVRKTDATR